MKFPLGLMTLIASLFITTVATSQTLGGFEPTSVADLKIYVTYAANKRNPSLNSRHDASDIRALADLRSAAEKGDAIAQSKLLKYYQKHELSTESEKIDAKWQRKIVGGKKEDFIFSAFMLMGKIRRRIRLGYPNVSDAALKKTHSSLGIALIDSGNKDAGIEIVIREALLLSAPAQIYLEIAYTSDEPALRYDPRILGYYRSMASEKLPRGMLFFAKIVYNGWGVPKSRTEAVKWFRLAAKTGLPDAQHALEAIYAEGLGSQR